MSNAIVFLDVDGVLVHQHYENKETYDIHPDKVRLLKHICEETNASVVIISSWRGGPDWTPKSYQVLRKVLENAGITVLGDAPHIPCELIGPKNADGTISGTLEDFQTKYTVVHGTGRAAEVEQYLKEHPTNAYVILDDEDFAWKEYGLHTHWVQPSWFGQALTEPLAEQAIEILKGNEVILCHPTTDMS